MHLIFQQPFHKKLFYFSIPLILSLLTQQFYSIADTMIVGQFLGVNELAAVGNAGIIVMLFIVVSGGIELASEILFSRYLGQKDWKQIAQGSVNVIVIALIVALVLCSIGFLALPTLYQWIQLPQELIPLTNVYIMTYLLGVPFIYIYDISRAIIIALGDSKRCFYFILGSSLLNIFLDLLFICVFQWGVFGAALATILSQALFMCFAFSHLYHYIKEKYPFSWKPHFTLTQTKELIQITLPSIFQQFVITASFVFIQSMINPFGIEIISGFVAVNKIMLLARIIILGFAQTFSIYTAQFIVSKNDDAIKDIYLFFMKLSLVYISIVAIIFMLIPQWLCLPFFSITKYPQGYQFFQTYLQCSIVLMFLSVFKFLNESFLRSSMHMFAFLVCNLSDLFLRIFMTSILISSLSTNAFWVAETIGKASSCLLSFALIYWLYQHRKPILSKET